MATPMGLITGRATESPTEDLLPLKIADLEVALDMCNNIAAFVSERVAELEKTPGNDEEIAMLCNYRRYILRHVKNKMSLENMAFVREFMDEFGPQLKHAFTTGETPHFLRELQPQHAG